jgi:2-C-methyl-D-erythritol 4-phosphate cytidylyltransferase
MPNTTSAIIVAAGSGTRFGADKLRLRLGRHSILTLSINLFRQPYINEIIVICDQHKLTHTAQLLPRSLQQDRKIRFILGGQERWQSSLKGIQAATGDIVAIHDAARPLADPALIHQAIQAASKTGAALLAMPAVDSIKLVNDQHQNYDAIDRRQIYLAQTPQVFQKSLILQAYEAALAQNYQQMTDESELVTRFLKHPVAVIPSTSRNLKITFPPDLAIAKIMASTQLK